MMGINKGEIAAKSIISEFAINNIQDIDIRDLIYARGVILKENILKNSDGRIVFSKNNAIITINSNIEYEGRKRFTLAHELGHFELHHNINSYLNDNSASLEYYKNGHQETEANEFATELLMPSDLFLEKVKNKKISPTLLRELAEYFQTSLTSVAFRYLSLGQHPIFIFHSFNNKMMYWKNSSNYFIKVKDITKLKIPTDSVAGEFYNENTIYGKNDDVQQITKDVWFETNQYDCNDIFYEFCIITPKYNTVISIVWED